MQGELGYELGGLLKALAALFPTVKTRDPNLMTRQSYDPFFMTGSLQDYNINNTVLQYYTAGIGGRIGVHLFIFLLRQWAIGIST